MPKKSMKEFIAADAGLRKAIFLRLAFYLLLIVCVSLGGFFYFESVKNSLIKEKKDDLSLIAELKVARITNLRFERVADADQITALFENLPEISRLLAIADKEKRQKKFYEVTKQFYEGSEYGAIYLFSKDLKVITFLDQGGKSVPLGKYELANAQKAIKEKTISFSDIYKNEFNDSIYIDVYAPIVENISGGHKVSGLIVLKIDPNKFLYPFVQSWPVPSKTFETLLVRKEGDNVLFLNKLRFREHTSLAFSIPLTENEIIAVKAAQGLEGITSGVDYRGFPVVAAIRSVPNTPWKLIAKVGIDELYAPVKAQERVIGILVLGFIIAFGGLFGFSWYRQISDFYRKQYESEVEHKVIARRCEDLLRYANVIIIVLDNDLKIVEANDKAVNSYQYTPVEILQLHLKDLSAQETLAALDSEVKTMKEKGNYIFKSVHKRRDGSTFPVEMIMQHFIIEWADYYQAVIRQLG